MGEGLSRQVTLVTTAWGRGPLGPELGERQMSHTPDEVFEIYAARALEEAGFWILFCFLFFFLNFKC
jgi:hypothetical protein